MEGDAGPLRELEVVCIAPETAAVAAEAAVGMLGNLGASVHTEAARHGEERAVLRAGDTSGVHTAAAPVSDVEADDVRTWAGSGLAALVGEPGAAPVVVDPAWLRRLRGLTAVLDVVSQLAGAPPLPVDHDAAAFLGERAALMGHRCWGATAPGGSCRMVAASDGWLAVNLPRATDLDAVPAWLELPAPPRNLWEGVAGRLAGAPRTHWLERAAWLGLAVAPVGPPPAHDGQLTARGQPVPPHTMVPGPPGARRDRNGQLLVVDLTALWAGPLAGSLLARSGARVVKVEHAGRPDGARRGSQAFYRLLNDAKDELVVDFATAQGRARLRDLCTRADIVLEASRPRALRQLGVDAEELAGEHGVVWVSITGYGRAGPWADRVAFGDDAGAAGGLVVPGAGSAGAPWFVGDAVADPITGVVAAIAGFAGVLDGRGRVFDVAMRDAVAGIVRGAPPTVLEGVEVRRGDQGWEARAGDGAWVAFAPLRRRSTPSGPSRGP